MLKTYIQFKINRFPNGLFNIFFKGMINQSEHEEFRKSLLEICCDVLPKMKGSWWYRKSEQELTVLIEKIWSFGPFRAKYNILFNAIPDYDRPSLWRSEFRFFLMLTNYV